jgi:uncharacterized membrane protein
VLPLASILMTTALLMASLVAFLALLHDVGTRIRVDTVLSDIGHRSRSLLRRAQSGDSRARQHLAAAPRPGDDAALVRYAGFPGQIVAVDLTRLRRLARRNGCERAHHANR